MKKTHSKRSGSIADFSFLITINFVSAPATRMPKRSLIYHTSGSKTVSTTAIAIARIAEITIISGVLLKHIEVISMKYRVEKITEAITTIQKKI